MIKGIFRWSSDWLWAVKSFERYFMLMRRVEVYGLVLFWLLITQFFSPLTNFYEWLFDRLIGHKKFLLVPKKCNQSSFSLLLPSPHEKHFNSNLMDFGLYMRACERAIVAVDRRPDSRFHDLISQRKFEIDWSFISAFKQWVILHTHFFAAFCCIRMILFPYSESVWGLKQSQIHIIFMFFALSWPRKNTFSFPHITDNRA